jgi:hypothetical protein
MTPREALTLLEALDVPFADDIVEALDEAVTSADELSSVVHWAGAELEAYRASIGLDARPVVSSGNDHLDWLTEHLI